MVGNNVLAHVPDLNDFVAGCSCCSRREGVITIEFPHLLRLIEENQFDTIYHEHFSYFSLLDGARCSPRTGCALFDVEELPTHGGSLRIFGCHAGDAAQAGDRPRARAARRASSGAGSATLETYRGFAASVRARQARAAAVPASA